MAETCRMPGSDCPRLPISRKVTIAPFMAWPRGHWKPARRRDPLFAGSDALMSSSSLRRDRDRPHTLEFAVIFRCFKIPLHALPFPLTDTSTCRSLYALGLSPCCGRLSPYTAANTASLCRTTHRTNCYRRLPPLASRRRFASVCRLCPLRSPSLLTADHPEPLSDPFHSSQHSARLSITAHVANFARPPISGCLGTGGRFAGILSTGTANLTLPTCHSTVGPATPTRRIISWFSAVIKVSLRSSSHLNVAALT